MLASNTQKGFFESINIDDDQFLNAMEHQTSYDININDSTGLVSNIENIIKYFQGEAQEATNCSIRSSPVKNEFKRKIASTETPCRSEGSKTYSPLNKRKKQLPKVKNNIQQLKELYESLIETESTTSPKTGKNKKPKLTKVKQLALLFNNKINEIVSNNKTDATDAKVSEAESSGLQTLNSLKPKAQTISPKPPTFVTKSASAKRSPLFGRKQLGKKIPSNSPTAKRKQLQKESSTTCLVAESAFSRLSVKDKILLYNKIMNEDKQNSIFQKHAKVLDANVKKNIQLGEVIFEKQNSVKHIRESIEARISHNKLLSKALQRFKKTPALPAVDVTAKCLAPLSSTVDRQDMLCVTYLSAVLKPALAKKKSIRKSQGKTSKDFTFDGSIIEPSFKRTQRMIRSSCPVEPFAPPKKIRRLPAYRDNVLTSGKVKNLLKTAVKNSEAALEPSGENDAMCLIKSTIEDVKSTDNSIIEVELPLAEEIPNKKTEADVTNLDVSTKNKTTSEESQTELKASETSENSKLLAKPLRKRKLRRTFNGKKNNSLLDANTILSTDSSDSDSKMGKAKKLSCCSLPKTKKCSNFIKNLIFKTTEKHNQIGCSPELSIFEFNDSLIRHVNSPSKIKNAYTLTTLSTPSTCSESDFCDDSAWLITPDKKISKSCPSLLEADLEGNAKLISDNEITKEDSDELCSMLDLSQQKLLMESFIDQGFETGSNEMDSPLKVTKKLSVESPIRQGGPQNFSTPYKTPPVETEFNVQMRSANSSIFRPIGMKILTQSSKFQTTTSIKEDTTSGESSASSTTSTTEHIFNDTESGLGTTCKINSSQFWIRSGNFTAALAIDHYDSEKLMLLSSKFSQMVLETRAMSFGIDEQKFTLNKTSAPDNLVTKVARNKEHSQYWFSNGKDIIPFIGNKLTSQKIQSFFNYIREFMGDESSLRFGIDGYEFSSIDKQTTNNSALFSSQTWLQPSISPVIKTSDFDQTDLDSLESLHDIDPTDMDSEENRQSLSFSVLDGSLSRQDCHSVEQKLDFNTSETQTERLKAQFTVPEMLKTLQIEHEKLRTLEEHMQSCKNNRDKPPQLIDLNYSPEYMHKLGNVISAIETIGRNNGFKTCTIEQLESFMFFLRRYSDICLINRNINIKKILDEVFLKQDTPTVN